MSSQKELYEDLSSLWPRMVEAARAGDRRKLSELEQSVHVLRGVAKDDSTPVVKRWDEQLQS